MRRKLRVVLGLAMSLVLLLLSGVGQANSPLPRLISKSTQTFYFRIINKQTGELEEIGRAEYERLQTRRSQGGVTIQDAATDLTKLTISVSLYAYNSPGEGSGPNYRFKGSWDWSTPVCGRNYPSLAWNGNLAIYDDAYGFNTTAGAGTMTLDTVAPAEGMVWRQDGLGCDSIQIMDDNGWIMAYVHQNGWQNQQGNVVFKFFHTTVYTVFGFSIDGSGPSVSISPTEDTAAKSVYDEFTY